MVKLDIVSIFPGMVRAGLGDGIVGRAAQRGLLDIGVHDLRDFTTDRHRVVDDVPFGGGPGMVMKPEPFFAAVDRIREERGEPLGSTGDRISGGNAAGIEAEPLGFGGEGGFERLSHSSRLQVRRRSGCPAVLPGFSAGHPRLRCRSMKDVDGRDKPATTNKRPALRNRGRYRCARPVRRRAIPPAAGGTRGAT